MRYLKIMNTVWKMIISILKQILIGQVLLELLIMFYNNVKTAWPAVLPSEAENSA